MSERFTPRQWAIVLLIAAVQFVNILDFVIIMPLGPSLAAALGIGEDHLGALAGSYTASACVTGCLGAFFLDRFDRRPALALATSGLVLGTLSGGFAVDHATLLAARLLAGAFGGPATSLAFSILADTIPAELRGRATGTVMGAFALAAVVGVPSGLWLAEHASWRAPFFAVGGLGVVVVVGALVVLPSMTNHLQAPSPVGFFELISRPLVRQSYLMTALVMMASFSVIPNIPAYVTLNLSFPKELLKFAYLWGGLVSLVSTQVGGRLVDRFGSTKVAVLGAASLMLTVYAFFVQRLVTPPPEVVYLGYAAFMLSNGLRNVAYHTLTSKVVEPAVRARFQSLQSAVQHGASAVAAVVSSKLLTLGPRPTDWPGTSSTILEGMPVVATGCIVLSALIPLLVVQVERRLSRSAPRSPA